MKFTIEEKFHELTDGYLTLIIKYSVVLMLAWMVGILIVFTYPCFAWSGNKYPPMLVFINDYNIINILLSVVGIYFYSKRLFKSYKMGMLVEIDFQSDSVVLSIINTLNGKLSTISIPSNEFNVIFEEKNGTFLGKQRIYHLFQKETLLTNVNIELTAWKRFSKLNELLAEFDKRKSEN
jgi:hypothetical protein